jgi:hypothetical protein
MTERKRKNEDVEFQSKKKKTISFFDTVEINEFNVFEPLIPESREIHEITKNSCIKLISSFKEDNQSLQFSSFKYYNLLISFYGVENIKITNDSEQFIINEILYDRETMIEKLKFLVAQETYHARQNTSIKMECSNIIRNILSTDNNVWYFVNLLFEFYHIDNIDIYVSDVRKNIMINQIVYDDTMLIKKIMFLENRKNQ